MSIEKGLQALLESASKENRGDVIQAISPFLTVPVICKAVESSPGIAGASINSAITRTSYTSSDVDAIFSDDLLKIKSHLEFIDGISSIQALDDDSRLRIFEMMNRKSFHKQSIALYESAPDQEKLINEYRNVYNDKHWIRDGDGFFSMLGHPGKWTIDTFRLLSMFKFEIPDLLTKYNRITTNEAWTGSRFDLQVDGLGNKQDDLGLGAPIASLINGKVVFSEGVNLAESFRREYARLNTQERAGGWNSINFPKYLPVVVAPGSEESLRGAGAVFIQQAGRIDVRGKNQVCHGFKDPTGSIPYADVAVATTLLSRNTLNQLLASNDVQVALLPARLIPDQGVEDIFSLEMSMHRPEVIRAILTDTDQHGLCSYTLYHHLFGRGVPVGMHNIEDSLIYTYPQAKIISSAEGIDFLKEGLATHGVNQLHIHIEPGEPVSSLMDKVLEISDKIGYAPNVSLSASMDFLEELSRHEMLFKITELYLDGDKRTRIAGAGQIFSNQRLCAKLGIFAERYAAEFGSSPTDLISKAIRNKNNTESVNIIVGMLDRYPLEELASAAKTDKQVEFLLDNFDFGPVMSSLAAPIRKKLSRKSLEKDFDL